MTLSRSTSLQRSPMRLRKPRPRKCAARSCRQQFTPQRIGQAACSVSCALEHARHEEERKAEQLRRARARRTRAELEALKPPGQRLRGATKRAQQAFNAFIRERDRDLPCISCGTTTPGGSGYRSHSWDCGHYRTTGAAPELRFEELNAARQCVACNRDRSGHVVEYRIGLIARIGQEAVDWLEGPHEPKRYTVEELNELAADYRRRTRELQRATA